MEKFWHELQFNPAAPVEVPFKPELIRSPPSGITSLRRLACRGRKRLERSLLRQRGKPKLVLGIPNDARTVAPLVALAHGPGFSRSNLDVVDNTTGANLSENQEQTTRKAKNPWTEAPIDTSSQPIQTTEQTTQVHAVSEAKLFAQNSKPTGSSDFIPETKSENQR